MDLVTITKSVNFERRAKRPMDMSLNVDKFENDFKIDLPTIYETNNSIFEEYLIT